MGPVLRRGERGVGGEGGFLCMGMGGPAPETLNDMHAKIGSSTTYLRPLTDMDDVEALRLVMNKA